MKAAIYMRYGPPEVVSVQEVERPAPAADAVLVKVRATTVTTADWRLRASAFPGGLWLPGRLMTGVLAPRNKVLGGEYAARRATLESLELVEGYGVELAMLVEVARHEGVESIAQVDLGVRRHGHQDLAALGRMSAQLLAVAMTLLADEQRPSPGPADALWQPTHHDGRPALRHHAVEVRRRPRLASTRPPGGPVVA